MTPPPPTPSPGDAQDMCKWYPVCPMKRFYERGRIDASWVETYCFGDNRQCVRYQMEETRRYHPDNMLPDGNIDERLEG